MVLQPSLNHIEMGMDSREEIIAKIKQLDYYRPLLNKADIGEITDFDISKALGAFIVSINADDTKFDRVHPINQEPPTASFTVLEEYGESIFNGKYDCNSCHKVPLTSYGSNGSLVNIGLDLKGADKGRMEVTGSEWDRGLFKVPGLRNVQFSAPYMHDGRFKNLNEVLEHYSHNIQNVPNLDWRLLANDRMPRKMNITDYDKKALIAFLNTLTDYDVLTHDRFSNPFIN